MHFLIALVFAFSPHSAPHQTSTHCLHFQGKTFCRTQIDWHQVQRPTFHPAKPIEHNPPLRAVPVPIPNLAR